MAEEGSAAAAAAQSQSQSQSQSQPQSESQVSSDSGQSSANPSADHYHQTTNTSGSHSSSHSAAHVFPSVMEEPVQSHECNNHGQGLYAVQFPPFMGTAPEFPLGTMIPLTYRIPARSNSAGAAGEQGQGGEAGRQQHGPQRQLRRFQFAFQLDLALLLKLAFAVILFSQEGSRKRTIFLVLLASLVYLYQTGVLTPLIQYARRVLSPQRPVAHPQNPALPQNAADRQIDDNAGIDNQNQQAEGNQAPEPERANGMNFWRIAREIQTFVIGFIASLFPGIEHHND